MDLTLDRDSGVPLATQLAWRLRSLIESGSLEPGDGLPSVRAAAAAAGVNVNTVRAAYSRLEHDGYVCTEHGRGSFVQLPEVAARRAFREQIAALEAELARRPPPPTEARLEGRRPVAGALLSAQELETIRDDLLDRLRQLDASRAALLRRLGELPASETETSKTSSRSAGHASPSRVGARIRWVGA